MRTTHTVPQLVKKKSGNADAPLAYLDDSSGSGPSMKRPTTMEPAAPAVKAYRTRHTHRRGVLKGGE